MSSSASIGSRRRMSPILTPSESASLPPCLKDCLQPIGIVGENARYTSVDQGVHPHGIVLRPHVHTQSRLAGILDHRPVNCAGRRGETKRIVIAVTAGVV